jgi:hypothetical protein
MVLNTNTTTNTNIIINTNATIGTGVTTCMVLTTCAGHNIGAISFNVGVEDELFDAIFKNKCYKPS